MEQDTHPARTKFELRNLRPVLKQPILVESCVGHIEVCSEQEGLRIDRVCLEHKQVIMNTSQVKQMHVSTFKSSPFMASGTSQSV